MYGALHCMDLHCTYGIQQIGMNVLGNYEITDNFVKFIRREQVGLSGTLNKPLGLADRGCGEGMVKVRIVSTTSCLSLVVHVSILKLRPTHVLNWFFKTMSGARGRNVTYLIIIGGTVRQQHDGTVD